MTLALWLHAIATVVFIGHYVLLAAVYVPALEAGAEQTAGPALTAISKRSRPWLYAALLVFAISGGYLTLVDPNYQGLGNFSSPWAAAMLVKHTVVFIMVVLGFWYNAIQRVGPMATSPNQPAAGIARFKSHANWMAGLGLLVLLLTAFSQVQ